MSDLADFGDGNGAFIVRDRTSSNEKFELPPLPDFDDLKENEEDAKNYKSNDHAELDNPLDNAFHEDEGDKSGKEILNFDLFSADVLSPDDNDE